MGRRRYAQRVDPLFEFALCVKALQRELERAANELMKPLGVTGPQADALVVIAQTQPIALNELGRLLIAEAGHPSRLVERLVEAGLVEREDAPGDRRRVELKLSPAGRRLARRVVKARQELFDASRPHLDEERLAAATAVMGQLLLGTPAGDVIARRRRLAGAIGDI
jgi:MarR family transcriptional regulator, organic hydroperoxide resistance regulator